jgi:peptide/nickel transport system permease protein
MTTATGQLQTLESASRGRGNPLRAALRFLRRKPLGAAGALVLLLMVAFGAFAPALAPYDPLEFHTSDTFQSPNSAYKLGSDDKGRDILSRLLYGARISLEVGFLTVALGTTFGLAVGLVSGYLGGKLDFLFQRVVDSFQAFPALILGLAVVTALKQRELHLGIDSDVAKVGVAVALATWPAASRVVRSAVLTQAGAMYVDAARSTGARTPRIMVRHILPNVISVYIILATAALAQAILVEASLSFLGAGVPAPKPSWGSMLLEAQRQAVRAPWMLIFPAIAISLAVFGFNLFGDALRDYLDPRLRGSR